MKILIEIEASDNTISKIEKGDMLARVEKRIIETLCMFGDVEVKVMEQKPEPKKSTKKGGK